MRNYFNVTIDDKIYKSVAEAARALGVSKTYILARVYSEDPKWSQWRLFDDGVYPEVAEEAKIPIGYTYWLTHKATGRFYVGSTQNIQNRRASHFWSLRKGKHNNKAMQALWDQDPGEDKWTLTVFVFGTREEAYEDEKRRIDNADKSLLLNAVTDVRSPISHVMGREGMKEKMAVARRRALKEMTPEQLAERSRKIREGQSTRWGKEGSKEAWSGGNNPFAKKVIAENRQFDSVAGAARELGIDPKTVWNRVRDPRRDDYRYLE
jgi:predicted GIY-YIG superfamily endonuclease